MYASCSHGGYLGTLPKWPSHQLKYHLQPRCCGVGSAGHPIQPHLQHLSTPGSRAALMSFCSPGLLHGPPVRFPFHHGQAPTPSSRRRCAGRPGDEACSPPCAGVPLPPVPHRWAPPSSCCAKAGCPTPSQPLCSSAWASEV